MKEEVAAAVVFLTRLVRHTKAIENGQLDKFSSQLTTVLVDKFRNHWYENDPSKGQGYRSLQVSESEPSDPVLAKAAQQSGILPCDLGLPVELTLFIDPADVTLRVGDNNGSAIYYTLVQKEKSGSIENKAALLDIDELIRLEDIRKSNEKTNMLEQSTRRKNYRRNTGKSLGANGGFHQKKYSFYTPGFSSPKKFAPQAGGGNGMNNFSTPWYTSSNHPYAQPPVTSAPPPPLPRQ